jgi:hypothetical protein
MKTIWIDRIKPRPFDIDLMKAKALAAIQDEEDRRLWMQLEGYWWIEDEREEPDEAIV